jgi:hypothetical protein
MNFGVIYRTLLSKAEIIDGHAISKAKQSKAKQSKAKQYDCEIALELHLLSAEWRWQED